MLFAPLALIALLAQQPGAPPQPAVQLPATIPLFPLGDALLFPRVTRPLLIFEPRYREMIADALNGDRIIGMVLLRPGWEKDYEGRPPIYEIGCAGTIVDYELLPDGRYTIVLSGLTKFRVRSEDQSRAYRLARVDAVADPLPSTDLAALSAARERLAMLLTRVLPPEADPPPPSLPDAEFVDLLAQYLPLDDALRQRLLELPGPLARARALIEALQERVV